MPGESTRPETTLGGRIRPWSVLLFLLVAVALASAGGEHGEAGKANSRSIPRAVKAVVSTPTPVPATPTPTPLPTTEATPEPTPVVTTPPPPVPTVLPQTTPPPPLASPPVYIPPPQPPASTHNALSDSVLTQINQRRMASGLTALAPNQALINAAQKYAELSFANGPYELSHMLDGMPGDRAARAGYSGGVGEVLATGEPSAQVMMEVWMASPPHQSVIMGIPYSEIGVGCALAPYTGADGVTWETALCVGLMGVPY